MELTQKISAAILEVVQQRDDNVKEVQAGQALADDLGFDSLDFAQLVATLEMELGVDPFAASTSIAGVKTVQDLVNVYARELSAKA